MLMQWLACLSVAAGAALGICTPASATSLSGTFVSDDQLFTTTFAVPGTMNEVATIRTLGYAGSVNLNGQTVPRGGFDPIVSLFSATGTLVGLSDDGIGVPVDAVSGVGLDSLLTLSLSPGLYEVVLSEYDNFPNGDLSTGFSESGQGDFTAGFGGCTASKFCDSYGFARTGNWALDISLAAPVSEPSSLALTLGGLTLTLVMMRKRRSGATAN